MRNAVSPYVIPGKLPIRFSREIEFNKPTWEAKDLDLLLEAVCGFFNIEVTEVKSKKRDREIVIPRQIFCFMAAKHSRASLKDIGRILSRDHTTVIHSIQTVKDLIFSDKYYEKNLQDLENTLLLDNYRKKIYS